jgi:hypothetical protein
MLWAWMGVTVLNSNSSRTWSRGGESESAAKSIKACCGVSFLRVANGREGVPDWSKRGALRMQVRFRILKGHFDAELSRVSAQADAERDRFLLGGGEGEAAPQAISAVEGTASLKQLRTLIEGGDLKLRDLVNVGHGWETLEECLLLEEFIAPYRRRAALRKLLTRVGIGALVLLVVAALIYFP